MSACCYLCWLTLYAPRWLAEPLVWKLRRRKPAWVAARQRLYARYVEPL